MPEVFKVNSLNRIMKSRGKQPVAWTQCQEFPNPFVSLQANFPGLPSSPVVNIPSIHESAHWQLIWVDIDTPYLPVSIGAIVIPPVSLLRSTSSRKDETSFDAFACTISASWAPSALTTAGANGTTLYAESTVTSWPHEATELSSSWAHTILSAWPSANDPNTTLLDIMMLPALQEAEPVQGTQTLLSGLIVAAMSQTLTPAWKLVGNPNSFTAQLQVFSNWPQYVIVDNGTAQDPWGVSAADVWRGLRVDTELAAEGLAYSVRSESTVVALLVLIVYSVYAVLFVVYVLVWRPESSSAWDSIAELAALAVLSTPTDRLRHTSAGIETLRVYREPVNIRAVEGDRLEIVFERDQRSGAVDLVRADEAY
ncbi:hypothetical protein BK809_0000345 [Diplodia seriata]|uniref:Uncharacterized protein n=1 Tax=Diplodia seriata TaxID=420778 RepID=A0A1S8BAF1_9PEZI|nr:hypothetical protein BK809_0000345 [Diplodia seriata]